jgi:quercetin dioxygenase-like cupin family protein
MQQVPESEWIEGKSIVPTYPEPGLERRIGAKNPRIMVTEHRMKTGWVGTAHSHPHDQAVYVVSGHLRVRVGDEHFEIRAGDTFVVNGGVEHQASALADSVVVDVFTPWRENYN